MKKPTESTIKNNPEIVAKGVGSGESLESKDRVNKVNVLRKRLATLKQSKGRSAEEFFTEFFAEQGIDEE